MSLFRKLVFTGGLWFTMTAACDSSSGVSPADHLLPFANSVGMRMMPVGPGSFTMGEIEPVPTDEKTSGWIRNGVWDDTPVHRVTIARMFHVAEEEVTIEQFRAFRPDYAGPETYAPYAAGVSWDDAVAYCRWLSEKEGKPYRLPTEAEWEFACRAGTDTPFWSGDKPPRKGKDLNPWGLKNMHSAVPEWCLDWHGEYPAEDRTDPVGPGAGWARVVRGGGLATVSPDDADAPPARYADIPFTVSSYHRSSLMPDCPAPGQRPPHLVGFRVVQAPMPTTEPLPREAGFPLECVKQRPIRADQGPDPEKPYFKVRPILPMPAESSAPSAIEAVGHHPAVFAKLHSGGLTICPNGDLLAVSFSSGRGQTEHDPNTTFVVARLRHGAAQWDMPSLFCDLAGLNDESALLWNDNGKLWFFGGGRHFDGVPFRFTASDDSGATWSPLRVPVLKGEVGPFEAQPIDSAFRGPDGTIYFGCDGPDRQSFLWASADEGRTWFDTGGRTAGRHSTFALLRDGRIMALGGKNTSIDGYMPVCFSSDWGRTYTEAVKTPFAAQGSNQRPTLLRLASGRLFAAGDFQLLCVVDTPPPRDIKERGAYVALSEDDGATWRIKKLPLVRPHNEWRGRVIRGRKPQHGEGTLGYSAAVQSPTGVIHLMTSKSDQAQHFELNEAWILSDLMEEANADVGDWRSGAAAEPQPHKETYPDGTTRATWGSRIGANDEYVLEGPETWFYPDGSKQYEVAYEGGRKVGRETYWDAQGRKKWGWDHRPDGTSVWTQYWWNGNKKSESTWKNFRAEGVATLSTPDGRVLRETRFANGRELE
ncbi:SUMF1/EgtB/PvdO family nonheme iron enzyme [Candidatus Sumerlaeota bacterium]|nr:SUMF1/EgtB/PvdO family nonheme iron enzyme [Candidatus Sumerlaeota bacterium]